MVFSWSRTVWSAASALQFRLALAGLVESAGKEREIEVHAGGPVIVPQARIAEGIRPPLAMALSVG